MKISATDQQLLTGAARERPRLDRGNRAPAEAVAHHGAKPDRAAGTAGVIGGYTVRVHDDAERGYIRAHIMITVLPKQMASVVAALHAMPEVAALHSVSGAFDLVAMGVVPTVVEMDELTEPHRRHRLA
jgi:hypothetical protein